MQQQAGLARHCTIDSASALLLLPAPGDQGGNCELMMETSGHGAMRSNHYLDDGSHLALTAVVAFVRSKLKSGGESLHKQDPGQVVMRLSEGSGYQRIAKCNK